MSTLVTYSQRHGVRERLLDRLGTKFAIGDGCWDWIGYRDVNGYGRFSIASVPELAHRLIYELMMGPIQEGLELDHLCRNHACVRPAHLDPVTHAVNMGRSARAMQTHCKHGHEFTLENTYVRGKKRDCRICRKRRRKEWGER